MSKAKAITNNIVENSYTRIILFRFLLVGLIIVSLFYVYLISSITFNVLARKSLESTVRTLTTNISQLELVYLSKTNQIDKDYALSQGFVDVKYNLFAARSINHVAIR